MDIITQRLKLKDVMPLTWQDLASKYGGIDEDTDFIRKGLVPGDVEFDDGERAAISYITTAAKDRDGEIVWPKGGMLKEYREHPVVMFGHDYKALPIGMNLWIKQNEKGLVAKTKYAHHEEAEKVYQYRKDGFPLAESIGFIPLSRISSDDFDEKTLKKLGLSPEDIEGVHSIYDKWILLEYSDVPVPSNPEALQIAISKGIVTKPEVTDEYIRIPAPGESGKHSGHRIRTIDISKDEGIKGLYCGECKVVTTYLFDKDKWSMSEAQDWVEEHSKMVTLVEVEKEATVNTSTTSSSSMQDSTIYSPSPNIYIPNTGTYTITDHPDLDIQVRNKEPNSVSQAEVKDELDYVLELVEKGDFSPENEALCWEITKAVVKRLPGDDMPDEIRAKAGAVLSAKNKSGLREAQSLIQEVLDSAETSPQELNHELSIPALAEAVVASIHRHKINTEVR
ncbi:MAG: hypothetical protein SVK08_00810 [Halobacteriota archaeon]|nr:hypothetical protein [Halobacteriota archaeon]